MGKIDNFYDSELVNSSIEHCEDERYNPSSQNGQMEFIDVVCQILRFYKKYKEEEHGGVRDKFCKI